MTVNTAGGEAAPLRVGVVGLAGWARCTPAPTCWLRQHYPDTARRPVLVAVADNAADGLVAAAAEAFGFSDVHSDWRELVARDDLDVGQVTGPNFLHSNTLVTERSRGQGQRGRRASTDAKCRATTGRQGGTQRPNRETHRRMGTSHIVHISSGLSDAELAALSFHRLRWPVFPL